MVVALIVGLLVVTNTVMLIVVLAHHRQQQREVKPAMPAVPSVVAVPAPALEHPAPKTPQLPAETVERLEKATRTAFEQAVNRASKRFDTDLDDTSKRLNQLIVKLTTDVVEDELKQYRQSLVEARKQAMDSLTDMQTAIADQQKNLEATLAAEVDKRRDYMLEQLDNRLGEVVAGYLVDSLGKGVDLGAQRSYLLDTLERNKAALKKDIKGEL